jgi:hypothetical protein
MIHKPEITKCHAATTDDLKSMNVLSNNEAAVTIYKKQKGGG